MNKKLKYLLKNYNKSILEYLKSEYYPKYYSYYKNRKSLLLKLVTPHYLGGNNIPNISRELVDFYDKTVL